MLRSACPVHAKTPVNERYTFIEISRAGECSFIDVSCRPTIERQGACGCAATWCLCRFKPSGNQQREGATQDGGDVDTAFGLLGGVTPHSFQGATGLGFAKSLGPEREISLVEQ